MTPYPLEGAHGSAACALCHARAAGAAAASLGPSRVVMRPAHEACTTCHRDPHESRFAKSAGGRRGRDCVACHGMAHFRPSKLDAAAHDAFAFHLEGAHRAVPCQACHAELRQAVAASSLRSARGRALTFAQSRTKCAECHETPHGDQFARRRDGGACESCHGLAAFAPADRFDHGRDAAFHLEGAHARARCASCHKTERTPRGPRVIWRPVSTRCESCHAGGVPGASGSSSSHAIDEALAAPIALTTREVSHASLTR